MKWELTKRTAILGRALACGFFLTVLAGFFPFAAASEELPQNIVRLHVVANSDSEEDQAVKLLVRDAVLEEAARWYGGARTMEEASARLCTHLESIAKTGPGHFAGAGDGLFRNGPGDGDVLSPPGDYEELPPARGPLPERCGSLWERERGRTGGAWCSPACACPPPPRRRPCSLCRRGSARWWRAARVSR